MAQLVYLRDKSILWNDDRSAFVMYAVRGRSCVALGDPVGPAESCLDLIHRFTAMCRHSGLTPVFYETSSAYLPAFAQCHLRTFKVGEEARVPLATFSLAGGVKKPLRTALHRMEREGLTFRVVEPAEMALLMPQLQQVSDEWIAERKSGEKGFSVGFFDREYIGRSPVAIMERNGRIEGFASLLLGGNHRELSVDLMRHRVTAPPGVMDALFVHVMQWAAARGYAEFNLGMAPLAGLPAARAWRVWTRAGQFVYRHGEAFYNFQGVRAYKSKFEPTWRPRYLVYPGGLALPRVAADVAALIAGGYVRMFLRPGRRAA
jgi:phosphatidylglycerol lysyltransferase